MTRDKEMGGGLKYQVNWFTIDQLNKLGITSLKLSYINPSEDQLNDIKRLCISWMEKNGFVLIEDPQYLTRLNNRHRLIEFGIQYHHIEDEL